MYYGGVKEDASMKTSVADRILERLQGFAEALERGEKIADTFTSRKVVLDLKALPYSPEAVKKIRRQLGTSQAVFAQLLGVSVRTVQAWECGRSEPSEMACRWLDEINRDTDYWLKRLHEAAVPKSRPRGKGKPNPAEA
jgi:putative transcriptional regulator